ncbi:MAG: 3-isopropylmalate dehydratase small subunit [Proteobacteria bacterium]|jgi:3-isopropylmalate/(R)-2-methylmalate dehydratase small subunit|nr:3-isopropylmalate dehydratase small subunit [Pseudomonadota bacterium]NCV45422.1 3-isopropylmalate dehydratase small subunit [Pseudomonadota bacterium]NCV99153.1 3-isopropylmalate dehydratase small subunit [Pseudomonadota bacterium]NCW10654.1 3-isopropylmalate dehydratase small subunit [Pseudomonadota bacterium]NCW37631.1 3-isopropylmalate dehydratase small subunit [Pseudomonadota bacterium]
MKIEGNELIIGGVVASIDRDNIDTDQIIPTEYLKSIKKFGFEDYLFDGWRYLDEGKLGVSKNDREQNPDFILNQAPYDKATILLTRDNFGCGSSREHAVWALRDFGIKIVIASSFGDIFYNNCFKNGVLPIKLDKNKIEDLFQKMSDSSADLSVSLDSKKIFQNENELYSFDVEDNLLERIIYGLDDVDMTLKHKDKILAFEQTRMKNTPWIFSND